MTLIDDVTLEMLSYALWIDIVLDMFTWTATDDRWLTRDKDDESAGEKLDLVNQVHHFSVCATP